VVNEIRIYIEGGGDDRETKAKFRMGFTSFFKPITEIVRSKRIRWALIASGSRQGCFDDFQMALQSHPQAFNIMLVDAEGEVTHNVIQQLRQRDNWELTNSEDHYQLMAQTMEAWFIADKDKLVEYYGQGFLPNAIPNTIDVEQIEKATLISSLERASRHTQKGKYAKIKHGAELMALIDPQIIRMRARHCDRLFQLLEFLVSE
jgi:hypothetical protein